MVSDLKTEEQQGGQKALKRSPSTLNSSQRLDICVAAKQRIRRNKPVLTDYDVDPAKVIKFKHSFWSRISTHEAIRCPTSPRPMYVYFGKSDYNIEVATYDAVSKKFLTRNIHKFNFHDLF